ncbi:putative leucine-rich repeat-containing protein DDB_G0290503 [Chironomus tepperi]|uniref:putative leucine-rich repeat-containing protein DDB_G0290503 n=1 Tax=Chironomus tepperi TaxID=113505 RepID=UPI00391FABE9
MKISLISMLLIITCCDSSYSSNIECSYITGGFLISVPIFYCRVNNDPNILTPESAESCTVSGVNQKTNDQVLGFYAGQKTLKYFPKCLNFYFKNLQKIYIDNCKMDVIHQSDLKPFTKLTHIYIVDSIKVIEDGLFDYNSNLEWIGLSGSKIIHIDSKVFDHLTKLTTLWLSNVPCVRKEAHSSRQDVEDVIKLVKSQCTSPKFQNSTRNKLEEVKTGHLGQTLVSAGSDVNLTDHESHQCPADLISNLKNISNVLLDIKSSQNSPISDLTASIATLTSKISSIASSQAELTTSHANSASSINEKLNSLESFQDNALESISDIKVTLSNIKTSQNDVKSTLSKLRTSQNDIIITLDEMNGCKCENSGDEFGKISEKLDNFEGHWTDFETKQADKLDKLEKQFINTRHKMEVKFDEKVKGIEKQLTRKFADFEEKFGKILEEKLKAVLGSLGQ